MNHPAPHLPRTPGTWILQLFDLIAFVIVAGSGILHVTEKLLIPGVDGVITALGHFAREPTSHVVIVTDTEDRVAKYLTLLIEDHDGRVLATVVTNERGVAAIPSLPGGEYVMHLPAGGSAPTRTFAVTEGQSYIIAVKIARGQFPIPAAPVHIPEPRSLKRY